MQIADQATVLGDFDDAEFDYFGRKTRFFRRDNDFIVATQDADGQKKEYKVTYTFGVTPLQQYLVEFPGGRMQALPFSWDARPAADGGMRWFHLYPDEYIGPGDELHWTGRYQNWNYMCAECHSTNLQMGYDSDADTFATTYSELSVGCEACHGPGSEHVSQANADAFDSKFGLAVNLSEHKSNSWVMNPQSGIAERSEPLSQKAQEPESCGRCHARRGLITSDYEYGKPLADTHLLALFDENLYFADGQIKDEVYVYGSFIQSRMYQAGVTCSNCHDPHSGSLLRCATCRQNLPRLITVAMPARMPTALIAIWHQKSIWASMVDGIIVFESPARTSMRRRVLPAPVLIVTQTRMRPGLPVPWMSFIHRCDHITERL